jgi:small subunit ribosomal protein S30e
MVDVTSSGSSKKGGRGTHGSTTKAGKVRMQTPKIPPTVKHKKLCPRLRNRRKYEKRILLNRKAGQNWDYER